MPRGLKTPQQIASLRGSVPIQFGNGVLPGVFTIDQVLKERHRVTNGDATYQGITSNANACKNDYRKARGLMDAFVGLIEGVIRSWDENFYIPDTEMQKVTDYAKTRWNDLRIVDRTDYDIPFQIGADPVGDWGDLHGGQTLNPRTVNDIGELWDVLRDGVEPQVWGTLVNEAGKLKVITHYKGMYFHVAKINIAGTVVTKETVKAVQDVENKSSKICYEDRNLPVVLQRWNGHIIVRQTKTPCGLCRQAYRVWAQTRGCSIAVSVEDPAGYDEYPANGTFLFSKTGNAAYMK